MKRRTALTALLAAFAALAIMSCGTNGAAQNGGATVTPAADDGFAAAMDRDWILSEIRSASGTVTLDRAGHAATFGDIFTLRFEAERVYGKAMPNTFRGPYTLGADRAITFENMAMTLMAAFMEPEELNEYEFMGYLHNSFAWNMAGGNFELHTTDARGAETVLVFAPL